MLQIPARPSGNVQLPYTTADMAERLAKRKAAKDRQDILDSLQGGLSYGKGGVDITPQLSQVGGMVKGFVQMPAATVMDVVSGIVRPLEKYVGGVKDPVDQFRPEDYGTSNLITGTAQGLEQAGRRAVGDFTAIPRVGKPSASPTATDIRRLGVIEGLSKAGIDYGNLALTAAPFVKPSAWGISNAYQDMLQARIARQNAPAYRYTGDFIDVDALQGSRLPARIVDTPATRLAEAQTQRALPPAQVAPIEVAPTTSRLASPAFRERAVPTSTKITVESSGIADPNVEKRFTIRAYDEGLKEYKGVLVMRWDPGAQKAIIDEMSSTNAMATPQLISAAAHIIRKTYGDIKFPIEPSSSLSAYSRPFVERLQQAGLIDSNYVLPNSNNLNEIDRYNYTPTDIASPNVKGEKIVSPLAYQPTYNEVLKSLVESRRQAKLQGEYGRLATPSNKLINEEQITDGFGGAVPIPYVEVPVSEYRNGISTGAQGFFIDEPKIIAGLNNLELEKLIDDLRRDPSNPMDLIDIAKRNDPDYLLDIFRMPGYLFAKGLINDPQKMSLRQALHQVLVVESRPARMAKFINDHIDPEWPELKRYLQRYGSVENFVNSSEAFGTIRFLEPFFENNYGL